MIVYDYVATFGNISINKMRVVVYIIAASILVTAVKAVNPKQLNLALETVLQFDKKDRAADIAVIDKVQDFLNQIKHGMQGSARRNTNNDMTFTDFILEAAKKLKSLDDNKLEDAFVVIKEESKRYVNGEKDLRELFPHKGIRRYINDQLDNVKDVSAGELRQYLSSAINVIEYLERTRKKNEALEIGNTLYNGASDKLRRALKNLDKIKRDNSFNLENIIRNTLEFLVYHHYLDLSAKVKSKLIGAAQYYWRSFIGEDNGKPVTVNFKLRSTPFRFDRKSKSIYTTRGYSQKKTGSKIKSDNEERNDAPEKQEVFITNIDLKKILNKKYEENIQDMLSASHITGKKKRNRKGTKETQHENQENEHMLHSKYVEDKKYARNKDSEEIFLMGGQVTRDFRVRAKSSSTEDYIERDRMEDLTSTEEIVIQHNNIIDVGLSRKSPGRLNITFVSTEDDKTYTLKNKASDEYSDERRIMRKSNVNDSLKVANDMSIDLKIMIQKLEEQLEAVKNQIEYVKSLTLAQSQRSDNNNEFSNKTDNVTSDEAVKPKSYSFRARYDLDTSEILNQNDTDITVTKSKSANTTDSKKSNKKIEITQEKTPAKAKTSKVDFNKSNKANYTQSDIGMVKNKTELTNKTEDRDNSVTEVEKSTAANLVDDTY